MLPRGATSHDCHKDGDEDDSRDDYEDEEEKKSSSSQDARIIATRMSHNNPKESMQKAAFNQFVGGVGLNSINLLKGQQHEDLEQAIKNQSNLTADNDQPGRTRNDVRAFGVNHNNNPTTHMSYSIMDLTNARSSIMNSL